MVDAEAGLIVILARLKYKKNNMLTIYLLLRTSVCLKFQMLILFYLQDLADRPGRSRESHKLELSGLRSPSDSSYFTRPHPDVHAGRIISL